MTRRLNIRTLLPAAAFLILVMLSGGLAVAQSISAQSEIGKDSIVVTAPRHSSLGDTMAEPPIVVAPAPKPETLIKPYVRAPRSPELMQLHQKFGVSEAKLREVSRRLEEHKRSLKD